MLLHALWCSNLRASYRRMLVEKINSFVRSVGMIVFRIFQNHEPYLHSKLHPTLYDNKIKILFGY